MFGFEEYELLDFGGEEKLERFGEVFARRETPAAIGKKNLPGIWNMATCRFQRDSSSSSNGTWSYEYELPSPWLLPYGPFRFILKPTPFGHLGVFAEQSANWQWLLKQPDLKGFKALNLFAYTGGTTMALAAKGCEVTHVDSSKSVVGWARDNAAVSGLAEAPIRWIVEDAVRYVKREIKRGNRYNIVVADPPSFGRGTKKETWKLERDLGELLSDLATLCGQQIKAVLISCHTPGFESPRLGRLVQDAFQLDNGTEEPFEMRLETESGRALPSGSCYRWSCL